MECLMFDGKTDLTRVAWKDENGRRHVGTVMEEHVTIVGEPGSIYVGHIAPSARDAVTNANEMWDFFVEHGLDSHLRCLGADSTALNTGHKGGIIRLLEEKMHHRLLICICKLHTNELPMRHHIKARGVPTLSNNKFGGRRSRWTILR